MKQRGSVPVGRLGTGEEDLRVGSNQGSYLEEVTCGSFYTSACWPALVIRAQHPDLRASLYLQDCPGNHQSHVPVSPSFVEGVSLSVSLHAGFDPGLCPWHLFLLAQLCGHLLLRKQL